MKLDNGTQMPGMYKQDIKGNITAITVEIPENVRVSNLLDLVSLLNIDRLIHKHDDSLVVDMLCLKIEARVDGSHDRSVADLLMAEVDTIRTNRMGILEVVTSCDMSRMQNYLDWHRECGYGSETGLVTQPEEKPNILDFINEYMDAHGVSEDEASRIYHQMYSDNYDPADYE